MHMADSLLSPTIGGVMWGITAGITMYSIRKIKQEGDGFEENIPLMGVMGAFIFACQMINFTIPGTGASGHIGGGMLLAILIGPAPAFITMVSILCIQALFFADGGLLALGANIFNLGFFACYVGYPLIYRYINKNNKAIMLGSIIATVIALQLGSLGVVMETVLSGKTELPFGMFLAFMQPIHLVIGIIEGILTGAVLTFLFKARPQLLHNYETRDAWGLKKVVVTLTFITLFIGGGLSLVASSNPDGLEWAIVRTSGTEEIHASTGIHHFLGVIQERLAILPDYGFKNDIYSNTIGTTFSGIVGAILTIIVIIFGVALFRKVIRKSE